MRRSGRNRQDISRPLAGQVVAITGGAQGIGRATATALAHRGCRVAIGDLDRALAESAASEIGPNCIALGLDVTDRDSFETFVEGVEQQLGPIDVLINNAGVMLLGPLAEETDEAMRRMIEINLVGVIFGTKLMMPRMRARGRGRIVNIASQAGRYAPPGGATYAATKHAVIGLTEAARAELRGSGVEMTWVAPFVVNTALGAGAKQMRGMGVIDPETVAEAIVEAISSGRVEVWIPRRAKAIITSSLLLPRPVRELIGRLMGADQVLAAADTHVRSDYQESAGRQSELSR